MQGEDNLNAAQHLQLLICHHLSIDPESLDFKVYPCIYISTQCIIHVVATYIVA